MTTWRINQSGLRGMNFLITQCGQRGFRIIDLWSRKGIDIKNFMISFSYSNSQSCYEKSGCLSIRQIVIVISKVYSTQVLEKDYYFEWKYFLSLLKEQLFLRWLSGIEVGKNRLILIFLITPKKRREEGRSGLKEMSMFERLTFLLDFICSPPLFPHK